MWDDSVDAVRLTKVVCTAEALKPAAPLPRTGLLPNFFCIFLL